MKRLLMLLVLLANPAFADQLDTWLCLHENIPVKIAEQQPMIGDKKLALTLTNNLGFALNRIAVDFTISTEENHNFIEQNIVFPFPATLKPSETVEEVAYFTITDAQARALTNGYTNIRGSVANVLDAQDRRMILREDIGPSFAVFWPFQPKSPHSCP